MTITISLFILAAIAFGIAAVKDGWLQLKWDSVGFCLLTIALFLV